MKHKSPGIYCVVDNKEKNLLKRCMIGATHFDNILQMEHSYSRDWRPMEGAQVMTTKTIMVHKPPQCPSCHTHDDGIDVSEPNPPIPPYNEDAARASMEEMEKIALSLRTTSSDDENWEERIKKHHWTKSEHTIFDAVTNILDKDHLARLANKDRANEPVIRRSIIDKSVSRIRIALTKVDWSTKTIQWLHGLLMDHLSPSYMASYLDILQTLKTKVPALADRIMFGRPISHNHDVLGSVLRPAWEPQVTTKGRKLPGNAVIVVVPSSPLVSPPSRRRQRWYSLFSTMGTVVPLQLNMNSKVIQHQPIHTVADQMIAVARARMQEIRLEYLGRPIILVGFNAGAAFALQLALVENVSSVICIGLAYNTLIGIRGQPDDKILDLTTPVMFVSGQNSARASQEEIESLREKMKAQTSLAVVGSADDVLRIGKHKRQIEGVTQTMADSMDDIWEFASTCIINPPAPRDFQKENSAMNNTNGGHVSSSYNKVTSHGVTGKKRKTSLTDSDISKPKMIRSDGYAKILGPPRKVGRPRIHPQPTSPKKMKPKIVQPSADALNMAIESILPKNQTTIKEIKASEITTSYTILTNVVPTTSAKLDVKTVPSSAIQTTVPSTGVNKIITIPLNIQRQMKNVKVVPPNQFIQMKQSAAANASKVFTLKPSPTMKQANSPLQYTVRAQPTTDLRQFKTSSLTPLKLTSGSGAQILSSVQIKPPQPKTTIAINPSKFTIVNQASTSSGTLINKIITTTPTTGTVNKLDSNISSTDIFDIPILFADNDGNIQDSETNPEVTTIASPSPAPIVISPQQNSRIFVNTANPIKATTISAPTLNKMVLINRSGQVKAVTTSPSGTIRPIPPLKYTRVLVSTPTSSPIATINKTDQTVSGATSIVTSTTTTSQPVFKQKSFLQAGSKVEIVNNTIIKSSPNSVTSVATQQAKYKPIVINVDSDKATVKSIIRVGDTQIKTPQTILLKPTSKTFPILNSGILNHRSLTVRKVVNLMTTPKQVTTTSPSGGTGGSDVEMIVVPQSTEE
ncbi:KAT8 regulatory NSL complex subunit 3 [Pseudolycoriella hygida]|uniref:KAT8 regulatory NSL complex subunit 3 n=1 Tax=Pseudolycoriella hygida TaxID=35572 RepID=A0A9Q0S565_9DIPT|nr:KAT8 regulatory NSL complex subunit 3 [Pseudolycoriella hygida]